MTYPSERFERSTRPIVLVSHGFQTSYERGFSNGLRSHGWEVTLLGSDETDFAGLVKDIRAFNARGSLLDSRPRWLKALNLLRYHTCLFAYSAWRRCSVIHVIGLIDPPLLRGVIQGLWYRLWAHRYVLTVHNRLPHEPVSALQAALYRLSYRLAERVVVHTELMRTQLIEEASLDPQRVLVMQHGCEQQLQVPDFRTDEKRVRQHSRAFRLLVFGRIEYYKGIDVLLKALAIVNIDWELTIVGTARDAVLTQDLLARIKGHPRRSRIEWRNTHIPESALPSLFAGAHCLLLPYRKIDQSGVLLQALRHGIPIVATRVASFADYVDSHIGELCQPDDPEDLARAIERLALRYHLISRATIAERGRSFDWSFTTSALTGLYASIQP